MCPIFADLSEFRDFIWCYYRNHGRTFLWRLTQEPYHIVVSEIMLQQTQTYRVERKYQQFIATLPGFQELAKAPLESVLRLWQGLGYNRRGKYLHDCAKILVEQHNGILPNNPDLLVTLPGIGKATAASICAFAFNTPTVFIETNIRSVFIHSFFNETKQISDQEIMPLIEHSLDRENPREWYYALMDYGVFLKKTIPNLNHRSCHYKTQSRFEGSDRQIRGAIIRLLLEGGPLAREDLYKKIHRPIDRVDAILRKLIVEKLINSNGETFSA